MFNNLLFEWAGLAGFAALIALIINILKALKVVHDGTADKWVAGLNLVGLIGLYVLKIIKPEYDVTGLDAAIAALIFVMTPVVNWVLMILASKLTYYAVRGLPLIGKSYSQ